MRVCRGGAIAGRMINNVVLPFVVSLCGYHLHMCGVKGHVCGVRYLHICVCVCVCKYICVCLYACM